MRTPTIGLALVLSLAAGCHSQSQPRSVPEPTARWERTAEATEPLESARTACRKEALEQTTSIRHEGTAARVAATIFAGCMRRHGWVQTKAEAR